MPLKNVALPEEWKHGLTIIYDGECPFCSSYVEYARLISTFETVRLVDIRSDLKLYDRLLAVGADLNDGMVVVHEGDIHFGAEAMRFLAQTSSDRGVTSSTFNRIFCSSVFAQLLYPILRSGRNLTLWILGRRKINGGG